MTFTPEVYAQIREGARRSAEALVPLVIDLIRPARVVDVGCGEGMFAREFAARGCHVLALDESVETPHFVAHAQDDGGGRVDFHHARLDDGDAWAYDAVRESEATAAVHGEPHPRPSVGERGFPYDLAVCLEVAEHLPAGAGDGLVRTLCDLAPVVLFSAAVPGQGGHGHLNEQWPDYWTERFRPRGRHVSGDLRWRIWNDDRIEPWYRQNLLVAATDIAVADLEDADEHLGGFDSNPLSVVHPITFSFWVGMARR